MTVYTIYIGTDDDVVARFKDILGNALVISKNHIEAEKKILNERDERPLMILYEKTQTKKDLVRIEFLKKRFPYAYVVLVTDSIQKEEIPQYQKAGTNDTVHKNVSATRLRNGIRFVADNQELIISSSKEILPLGMYKCPLYKRVFDIAFSLSAIILLSPILIITSVAIAAESKGPVIYKSKRVGSNYKIFDFLKFRSMYKDADKRLKDFMDLNQYNETNFEEDGKGDDVMPFDEHNFYSSYFYSDSDIITEEGFLRDKSKRQKNNFIKYTNDPRITKVGKIIRKFSIDELPQLFNVLKGDMSIVGNRPLPLYEAEQLTSDRYIDRFMGPSGLTGLWQVEKRGDSGRLSPEERKMLDIFYAKHYSLWMDIKIIFKTFSALIQKENV